MGTVIFYRPTSLTVSIYKTLTLMCGRSPGLTVGSLDQTGREAMVVFFRSNRRQNVAGFCANEGFRLPKMSPLPRVCLNDRLCLESGGGGKKDK